MNWPKPSRRYAEYVRKITCDEWAFDRISRNSEAVIRHTSGATVSYGTHDGGNDQNSPRNFAQDVQRICGCRLIEPRGRKRSRKSFGGVDPQIEASRRKHAEQYEATQAERDAARDAEQARRAAAANAAADDRRRREIEELMR